MFDVIIIGAGPAGTTTSLYTQRGNLKTLMIHNEESTLSKAKTIENYYGFEDGITGEDLYYQGIKQASNLGVEVIKEETLKIEVKDNYFEVITTQNNYEGKTIVLATGTKKKTTNIKGIKEFEGKGISYCAICDGFFYRNREVAVLGNGNYAISEINDLINIVSKITLLTDGENVPEFRNENINVNTKKIKELRGSSKVEEIEFEDKTILKTDGIFIAQGTATSIDFAKKIGIITKDNHIIVNENMETNVPGIYACGDCTGGLLQISKAVYEGTKAGLQVIKYIKEKE